jgi:predicted molibdopterin-dependent oxidoreductase YjgC
VLAPDFARPSWKILVQLARRAGLTLDFSASREIFDAMKQEIPLFNEAEWGEDLPPALLRFAGSRG